MKVDIGGWAMTSKPPYSCSQNDARYIQTTIHEVDIRIADIDPTFDVLIRVAGADYIITERRPFALDAIGRSRGRVECTGLLVI